MDGRTDIRGRLFDMKKISLPVAMKMICFKKQKEAPFCIRLSASYMAEAALALPFFTGFLMALLFFFQTLAVQQEVGNALLSAARKLSVTECETEAEAGADLLASKVLVTAHIGKDSAAERFIRGGRRGVTLSGSKLIGDYVMLRADYRMRLPFSLFGMREIEITQSVKCRRWTGGAKSKGAAERLVYITPNGSVYHWNRNCSYLNPAVRGVGGSEAASLRNADGGKYYACVRCMKNKELNQITVYVAKYGNRYHGDRNCSRIKRTATAVFLSEVKDKRSCSKCKKE